MPALRAATEGCAAVMNTERPFYKNEGEEQAAAHVANRERAEKFMSGDYGAPLLAAFLDAAEARGRKYVADAWKKVCPSSACQHGAGLLESRELYADIQIGIRVRDEFVRGGMWTPKDGKGLSCVFSLVLLSHVGSIRKLLRDYEPEFQP